jgi:hypothetical protein
MENTQGLTGHELVLGCGKDGMAGAATPVFVPHAEGDSLHTLVVGTSGQGKSMLARLNDVERQAWSEWMTAHPGVNGMDWPGWAAVGERET